MLFWKIPGLLPKHRKVLFRLGSLENDIKKTKTKIEE
jgi:hypothetical protein